jgi:hypothetical protein
MYDVPHVDGDEQVERGIRWKTDMVAFYFFFLLFFILKRGPRSLRGIRNQFWTVSRPVVVRPAGAGEEPGGAEGQSRFTSFGMDFRQAEKRGTAVGGGDSVDGIEQLLFLVRFTVQFFSK